MGALWKRQVLLGSITWCKILTQLIDTWMKLDRPLKSLFRFLIVLGSHYDAVILNQWSWDDKDSEQRRFAVILTHKHSFTVRPVVGYQNMSAYLIFSLKARLVAMTATWFDSNFLDQNGAKRTPKIWIVHEIFRGFPQSKFDLLYRATRDWATIKIWY